MRQNHERQRLLMQAIIAGGGIGGISAAICLAQKGWQICVLEQAFEIAEVGAGIQISPNGVKLLEKIGVMPHLEDTLFEPKAIEMRDGISGRTIFNLPMKAIAGKRWGARYIQIHRADLIAGLLARLKELQPDAVKTNAKVTTYTQDKDTVSVVLENGETFSGDLLIGADGIHSTIRKQLLGSDASRFTGNVAWRAIVPADLLGDDAPPPYGCIWAGPGKHAVTTRIKGGSHVNFVGIVEQDTWQEEGWKLRGTLEEALRDFGGWNTTIDKILHSAPELHRWALFDRAPLQIWSNGSIALLGDAAHPMLPSMAQGAVQSIEDAWVLADEISKPQTIEAACQNYFNRRIKRTSMIQETSAFNLRLFHHRHPLKRLAYYVPMWLIGRVFPSFFHRRNDWIFGEEDFHG